MKKVLKKAVLFKDTLFILFGFFRLIFKPNDISPIFVTKSFREHKSFELALDSLRSKPEVLELIRSRYLSARSYDPDELLKLPEGSLGKVYAQHMIDNKLEVEFYPPMEDNCNDDINYLINRARQTHDIHHVVLGFPAVDIGEMTISAFYLSQNPIPLSALLLGIGFLHTIIKQPHRINELVNAIFKGWYVGKKARDVFGVRWEEYFTTPIEQVRKELNIQLIGEDEHVTLTVAKLEGVVV